MSSFTPPAKSQILTLLGNATFRCESTHSLEDEGGGLSPPPPPRPAKTGDLQAAAAAARTKKKFRRTKSQRGVEESSDEDEEGTATPNPDYAGLGLGLSKGGKGGNALSGKLGTEDAEDVVGDVVPTEEEKNARIAIDDDGEDLNGGGAENGDTHGGDGTKDGNGKGKGKGKGASDGGDGSSDASDTDDMGGGGFFCCCGGRKKPPRHKASTTVENAMFDAETKAGEDGGAGTDAGPAVQGEGKRTCM